MRLNNVVIAARDHLTVADFYRRLTGWNVLFENATCTFLGAGRPHLVVHSIGPETEVAPPEGTLCLDFEVDDLELEVARLRDLEILSELRGSMIVLRDPVGNLVEITQSVNKPPESPDLALRF